MEKQQQIIGDSAVYQRLGELQVSYAYHEHPPIPTIALAMERWKDIDCRHCKNLFLRNHKGNRHYLLVLDGHNQANIRSLELMLGQGKLSFASEKRMEKYLGVKPGSVSPLGLVHDAEQHVYVYLDDSLRGAPAIGFHPNDNRATLVISGQDLIRYIEQCGNSWEYINLSI
ncbi:MAG: prolyl-tRNA editing protein [Bacteroidetes bacterium]|nr:MAG: prolyl-tRNA editing protein [Bacteroidota bacterium]